MSLGSREGGGHRVWGQGRAGRRVWGQERGWTQGLGSKKGLDTGSGGSGVAGHKVWGPERGWTRGLGSGQGTGGAGPAPLTFVGSRSRPDLPQESSALAREPRGDSGVTSPAWRGQRGTSWDTPGDTPGDTGGHTGDTPGDIGGDTGDICGNPGAGGIGKGGAAWGCHLSLVTCVTRTPPPPSAPDVLRGFLCF